MIRFRSTLGLCLGLVAGAALADGTVTLRVHHFLAPNSNAQTKILEPWCAKILKESAGKMKCQIYPAMQLGGTPPQLFDQAKDGVADIVWTVPTYQSGRFSASEVFELPFMIGDTQKGSRALWEYATKYAADEYKGIKPIAFHVHDGALIHTTKKQIKTLADFKGLKLRAPTRQATHLVAALGGTPVPMPAPQVPEALDKGVIDGALLPWEVVPALKVQEIAKYHTEIDPTQPKISNTIFVIAMNQAKYASLPPDLKKVIDANSGADVSAWCGKQFDDARVVSRKTAEDRKNTFYTVPAAEVAEWQKAAAVVYDEWAKEVSAKGYDAKKLLAAAKDALK